MMDRVDITIQIHTGLTWEEDDLLEQIDTGLYKEIGGGKVTLYAEREDDISEIPKDIQRIRNQVEDIRRAIYGS